MKPACRLCFSLRFHRFALRAICLGAAALPAPFAWGEGPGAITGWNDTNYPDFIEKVTDFGERADWSHDGTKILFVARTFGDVYEYNLTTRRYRPLTHHYYHGGYTRALYLSNGDILLSGPEDFPGNDWRQARFFLSELWVLSRKLDRPPTKLGEVCWEGPAVSRTRLRIAWSQFTGPAHGPGNPYRLQVADLDYSSGEPALVNQRVVLTNDREPIVNRLLEAQNFRPGREEELIFSAARNFDVYGLNYNTGEVVNYSRSPDTYDEAEGTFPDGEHILVESSRGGTVHTSRHIDLWKLRLDPNNPSWQRLTWFTVSGKFKASNPVVSDDGRFIAFQVPRVGDVAGIGHGIYVMDMARWTPPRSTP